jgi:hypothetical protein
MTATRDVIRCCNGGSVRLSKEQLRRWRPAVDGMRAAAGDGGPVAAFRLAADLAAEDAEFLAWWRGLVEGFAEPVRGRAISFLRRLEERADGWEFEREFRASFN